MPIGFHLDDIERESFSHPQGIYELKQQIRNLKKQLETARAEAIKEFAEKVKENQRAIFNTIYSKSDYCKMIDKLVRETMEKDNG